MSDSQPRIKGDGVTPFIPTALPESEARLLSDVEPFLRMRVSGESGDRLEVLCCDVTALLDELTRLRASLSTAEQDSKRIDRLPVTMTTGLARQYDWLKGTPELVRAALDLAWKGLPTITKNAFEGRAALHTAEDTHK